MVPLAEIQNYCRGQRLLLIGNGAYPKHARRDLTLRINYGMMGGHADIWVNNIAQDASVHHKLHAEERYILRLNAEYLERIRGTRMHYMYPQFLHSITYFWNNDEFEAMASELDYARPLSGTIAIYWLLKYTQPESLTITGFDLFKTPNQYAGTVHVSECHNLRKDARIMQRYVERGELRWI